MPGKCVLPGSERCNFFNIVLLGVSHDVSDTSQRMTWRDQATIATGEIAWLRKLEKELAIFKLAFFYSAVSHLHSSTKVGTRLLMFDSYPQSVTVEHIQSRWLFNRTLSLRGCRCCHDLSRNRLCRQL